MSKEPQTSVSDQVGKRTADSTVIMYYDLRYYELIVKNPIAP